MKTPPFLMAAALLFWGWRTELLLWAIPLALILELARLVPTRWEFTLTDLKRVFDLCCLLVGGEAVILLSAQDRVWGEMSFKFAQWLPFSLFPIMLAQAYGSTERMPFTVFSLFLRRYVDSALAKKTANVSYLYFCICLLGASATARETIYFFPIVAILISLALVSVRPQRTRLLTWCALVGLAGLAGLGGMRGLSTMQSTLEASLVRWIALYFHRDPDVRESRTAIGRMGRVKLSGRIVLRVTPEGGEAPPGLLREVVYDHYKNGVWHATNANDFIPGYVNQTTDTAMLMAPTKVQHQVRIAAYLNGGQGLLPLPQGTFELRDLPVGTLNTNRMGTAKVDGGPGLINFLALYGPGASFEGPTNSADLEVTENERPVLEQITGELQLAGKSDTQIIHALQQFFENQFTYSLNITSKHIDTTGSKTAVGQFLTEARSGHCEYFATSTVLLLRQAGIPARYVTGYGVEETSKSGKTYIVRERHAHAWTLVYRKGSHRWEELDTTPASWDQVELERASVWENFSDAWSRLTFEFLKWRYSKTSYILYLRWLLVPLIAFFLWRLLANQRRKRGNGKKSANGEPIWPGWDSDFYRIEDRLSQAEQGRMPNEFFGSWVRRISPPSPEKLDRLSKLHVRLRFDPKSLNEAERQELKRGVEEWLAKYEGRG